MLNQISERQIADSAIPKPGQKIPESAQLSSATNEDQSDQAIEDQEVMFIEVALARALQQLTSKPEN
jgi:hypothetical protein